MGGKEFQAHATATGNAWSPRVDRRVDGTTSVDMIKDVIKKQRYNHDYYLATTKKRITSNRVDSKNEREDDKIVNTRDRNARHRQCAVMCTVQVL